MKNKDLTGAGGVVYQFCRYLDSRYDIQFADKYIGLHLRYYWRHGFNVIL